MVQLGFEGGSPHSPNPLESMEEIMTMYRHPNMPIEDPGKRLPQHLHKPYPSELPVFLSYYYHCMTCTLHWYLSVTECHLKDFYHPFPFGRVRPFLTCCCRQPIMQVFCLHAGRPHPINGAGGNALPIQFNPSMGCSHQSQQRPSLLGCCPQVGSPDGKDPSVMQ